MPTTPSLHIKGILKTQSTVNDLEIVEHLKIVNNFIKMENITIPCIDLCQKFFWMQLHSIVHILTLFHIAMQFGFPR